MNFLSLNKITCEAHSFWYFQCLGHFWFLAVDMQLFIVAPLIVYLIYRFNVIAIIFLVLTILGSTAWTVIELTNKGLKGLYVAYDMPLAHFLQFNQFIFIIFFFRNIRFLGLYSLLGDKLGDVYKCTHLRCSSYLIGMITGYILLKYQNSSIRIPKVKHQPEQHRSKL